MLSNTKRATPQKEDEMTELHDFLRIFFKHEKDQGLSKEIQLLGMNAIVKTILDEVYENK